MPTSVVHSAVALMLAVGLLGRFYDRKALGVVLALILFPELDTTLGWVMDGAHRTVLHNMVFGVVAAGILYWETNRPNSRIRGRVGEYGVRLAWVGLFVHTFAHLSLDWAHLSGINVFWPVVDQFFTLDGELYVSSTRGIVQTFVDVRIDPETGRRLIEAGQGGTTQNTHIGNPVQPTADDDGGPVNRKFPIAVGGWQLYLVLTGAFVLVGRKLQTIRSTK